MQEHQGTECCLEPCLQYIYSPTEFHLLFGLLVLLGKQCGVMKKNIDCGNRTESSLPYTPSTEYLRMLCLVSYFNSDLV